MTCKHFLVLCALIGCKKEPEQGRITAVDLGPDVPRAAPPPDVRALPLQKGECWDDVEVHMPRGYWRGQTMCKLAGYWWRCGTGQEDQRECKREAKIDVPAEKPLDSEPKGD